MESTVEALKKYLRPGNHVHLVGIGGVSMRPLGLVLQGMGLEVTGSDMNSTLSTDELIAKGIRVEIGHRAENIQGACCIIRTAAVHNDNPEIAAARVAGIPVFERAQAWGVIMQAYRNAICVAGTHGKTTTTSMLAHVLMAARTDPTVMIGGNLPLLGAGHRVGQGDTILLESCEYCDSFLNFSPTVALILNIEADHLDYFKDLAQIQASFRKFAALATDRLIVNADDENTLQAVQGMDHIGFGLGEQCDVRAVSPSADWHRADVYCRGEFYCRLDLAVVGKHNLLNALAAMAVAWTLGIDGTVAADSLKDFHGAARRMQYKGTFHGAALYDDYAHHPGELAATIATARLLPHQRLVVAFQPHTYTRTQALFDDFVRELKRADVVILAEIYAARERNTIGISSQDLQRQIPGSIYCETLPQVTWELARIARPGDLIFTVGAGDIYRAGEALLP